MALSVILWSWWPEMRSLAGLLTVQWPTPASSVSGPAGSLRGALSPRRPGSAAGRCSGRTGGRVCEGAGDCGTNNSLLFTRLTQQWHTKPFCKYVYFYVALSRHWMHFAKRIVNNPEWTYQKPVLLQNGLRSPTGLPTSTPMTYGVAEASVTKRSNTAKMEKVFRCMSGSGHVRLYGVTPA